ncbi:MAG: hypothetical protein IJR87_12980 [Bacteroidaceae bacterium]|nr:hypothetical protein [Bacteroidaceae bacterium]
MEKKIYQKPATQVIQLQQRTSVLTVSGDVDSLNDLNSLFQYQGMGDPSNPLILIR